MNNFTEISVHNARVRLAHVASRRRSSATSPLGCSWGEVSHWASCTRKSNMATEVFVVHLELVIVFDDLVDGSDAIVSAAHCQVGHQLRQLLVAPSVIPARRLPTEDEDFSWSTLERQRSKMFIFRENVQLTSDDAW